jgi:mevalonate kinase
MQEQCGYLLKFWMQTKYAHTGIGVSHSQIRQLAAEVKKNGGNGKMGGNGGNGESWEIAKNTWWGV